MKRHFRRSGGVRTRVRSGTIVLAPTNGARSFVHNWEAACSTAPAGEVDQAALQVAMGNSFGTTFQNLLPQYCAIKGEHPDPVILDDQASRGVRKISNWKKRWWALTGKR
jgi:hypothetical protein